MRECVGMRSWGRVRNCVRLTEGNYYLAETRGLTSNPQPSHGGEKQGFRNFPEVQVLVTGLGSSGMLPDGNQHSDF